MNVQVTSFKNIFLAVCVGDVLILGLGGGCIRAIDPDLILPLYSTYVSIKMRRDSYKVQIMESTTRKKTKIHSLLANASHFTVNIQLI